MLDNSGVTRALRRSLLRCPALHAVHYPRFRNTSISLMTRPSDTSPPPAPQRLVRDGVEVALQIGVDHQVYPFQQSVHPRRACCCPAGVETRNCAPRSLVRRSAPLLSQRPLDHPVPYRRYSQRAFFLLPGFYLLSPHRLRPIPAVPQLCRQLFIPLRSRSKSRPLDDLLPAPPLPPLARSPRQLGSAYTLSIN